MEKSSRTFPIPQSNPLSPPSSKDFITWIKLSALSVFPDVPRIALGAYSVKTEQQPFKLTKESKGKQPGGTQKEGSDQCLFQYLN